MSHRLRIVIHSIFLKHTIYMNQIIWLIQKIVDNLLNIYKAVSGTLPMEMPPINCVRQNKLKKINEFWKTISKDWKSMFIMNKFEVFLYRNDVWLLLSKIPARRRSRILALQDFAEIPISKCKSICFMRSHERPLSSISTKRSGLNTSFYRNHGLWNIK